MRNTHLNTWIFFEVIQLSNATSSLKIFKWNNGTTSKFSLSNDNRLVKILYDNFDRNKIRHFLKSMSNITKIKVT